MTEPIHQGDILKIEKVTNPVLVVSKDYFNQTGEIIGCPIYRDGEPGALHIKIDTDEVVGYVQCEKIKLLDMNVRGFSQLGRIHIPKIMDITDAIQSIFDYV